MYEFIVYKFYINKTEKNIPRPNFSLSYRYISISYFCLDSPQTLQNYTKLNHVFSLSPQIMFLN